LRIIDNAAAKHQLAQIRVQEDIIYTQMTQTSATLALATTLNTGSHVAQTEGFFIESAVDMSEKRNQTIRNQDETQSTIDKTNDSAEQTSEKIQALLNNNEEDDL